MNSGVYYAFALWGSFATCLCVLKVKLLSRVQLFATPWTVAYQASPSMGFSRQEYWHGLSFPSPGDLPDPEIEPGSPALQADALPSETAGKPQMCPEAMYYLVFAYLDHFISGIILYGFLQELFFSVNNVFLRFIYIEPHSYRSALLFCQWYGIVWPCIFFIFL